MQARLLVQKCACVGAHVHALLQGVEAGLASVVEGDDFTVEDEAVKVVAERRE